MQFDEHVTTNSADVLVYGTGSINVGVAICQYSWSDDGNRSVCSERRLRLVCWNYLTLQIVSIIGADYKWKVETTYTHSWVHGSSHGWWNATTLGMNSWLMVPPNTLANISVVSNYAYAMHLPFTATYQRMYTDVRISCLRRE